MDLDDVTLSEYNALDYLDCEDAIAGYLEEALEEDLPGLLDAVSDALKARAINQLAIETGIDREKLCRMFAGATTEPDKTMVLKVARSVIKPPLPQGVIANGE